MELTPASDTPAAASMWDIDYERHELPTPMHVVYFETDGDDLDANNLRLYSNVMHPAECDIDKGCFYSEIYVEYFEEVMPEGIRVDDGTLYLFTATIEKIPVYQSYLGYEYGDTMVEILAEIEP